MRKVPTRVLAINAVLVLAIGGGGYWGWTTLHPKAAPVALQTTTVSRGDVQSTVSASGKVISPGDIGLAPLVAGTLKTLNVKVGDHVSAGQTLAALDTSALATAETQALSALISAKASVASAASQITQAQLAVDTANQNLTNQLSTNQQNLLGYQATVDAAKKALDDATTNQIPAAATYQQSIDSAQRNIDSAKLTLKNLEWTYEQTGVVDINGSYLTANFCINFMNTYKFVNPSSVNSFNSNCLPLIADTNAVTNAQIALDVAKQNQKTSLVKDQQSLQSLQTAYSTALSNQKINIAKDQDSLTTFRNAITTAQANLDNLKVTQNIGSSEPTLAQLQQQIAQANYDQAVKNVAGASVIAPVSGDVASISTAVGGNVGTAFTQATNSTTATGFIVLTNTTALRVTASFSEADAAKILAGQDASFTFDALPNENATGKVLQVDLLPTTSGGVTSYSATFSVDGKVTGLKVGMTATATVITGYATGVIQVSAQAVTTRGGNSFVNVVTTKAGVQVTTPTPVIVGLKGDSADEIQSGLKEGEKVSLPTVTRTTSSNGFAIGGVPGGVNALAGAGGVGGGGGFGRGNG